MFLIIAITSLLASLLPLSIADIEGCFLTPVSSINSFCSPLLRVFPISLMYLSWYSFGSIIF